MSEENYLTDSTQQIRKMEAQDYDGKNLLQTLLTEHPDLLAGTGSIKLSCALDAGGERDE